MERESERDHQARYYQTLINKFSDEGAYVSLYFYKHDARVCSPTGSRHTVRLPELASLHPDHRLVIIGDGAGLLHPVQPSVAGWTHLLENWDERAFLSTIPRLRWGSREKLFQHLFKVVPATLDGFSDLSDRFDGLPISDGRLQPRARFISLPPTGHSCRELRDYLGDPAFRLLCACAIYPEVHWELTIYYLNLLGLAGDLLNDESKLLRLFALPWFRSGVIPNPLRHDLLVALERMEVDGQNTEMCVRSALAAILANEPDAESVSGYNVRRELLLQRLYLARESRRDSRALLKELRKSSPDAELLQDATIVRVLGKVRPSRLSLILPPRVRRVVYRHGLAGFGFRRGLLAAAGATVAAAVIALAPEPWLYDGANLLPRASAIGLAANQSAEVGALLMDTAGFPVTGPKIAFHSSNPRQVSVSGDGVVRFIGGDLGLAHVIISAAGHRDSTMVVPGNSQLRVTIASPRRVLRGATVAISPLYPESSASEAGDAPVTQVGSCTPDALQPIGHTRKSVAVRASGPGSSTVWVLSGNSLELTTAHVFSAFSGPLKVVEEPIHFSLAEELARDGAIALSERQIRQLERKVSVLRSDTTLRFDAIVVARNPTDTAAAVGRVLSLQQFFRSRGLGRQVVVRRRNEHCVFPVQVDSDLLPDLRVDFFRAEPQSTRVLGRIIPSNPNPIRLIVGDSVGLSWHAYDPNYSGAVRSDVRWESANPRIATTDSRIVRAIRPGSTYLVATSSGFEPASLAVTVVPRPPIARGYLGTWRNPEGAVYRFALNLEPGPQANSYRGFINWTLLEEGGFVYLAEQVGDSATEFVHGQYDPRTDTLALMGDSVSNPELIARDQYRFGFSLTRDTISGNTRCASGSEWDCTIRGRAAPPPRAITSNQQLAVPESLSAEVVDGQMPTQLPHLFVNGSEGQVWWPNPDAPPLPRTVGAFGAAVPWLTMVDDMRFPGESWAEVDYIRLWALVGDREVLVAENGYDDGRVGGGLFSRAPWFAGFQEELRSQVSLDAGVVRVPLSTRPDRVWHVWLVERQPNLRPLLPSNTQKVWIEIRVRIRGRAAVQIGWDYYRGARDIGCDIDLDGVQDPGYCEAGKSNWIFGSIDGGWQVITLGR